MLTYWQQLVSINIYCELAVGSWIKNEKPHVMLKLTICKGKKAQHSRVFIRFIRYATVEDFTKK